MQTEFSWLDFIHVPNGRYLVWAIGLSYDHPEDAQIVADRYDGKVFDQTTVGPVQ